MERNGTDANETAPEAAEDFEEVEEAARAEERDAARRNPDPLTRRETIELDLMDEDRSELGEHIGDEMP